MGLLGAGGFGLVSSWTHGIDLEAASQAGTPLAGVPSGAIIRTVLKDVPPQAVGPGATVFHDHLVMRLQMRGRPQAITTPPVNQVVTVLQRDVKDGLSCVVDGSCLDMGRNIGALKEIAKRVPGLHVVACGGYYTQPSYPDDIATKSEDQLADEIAQDAIQNPVGAFGEIGTSTEITPDERKVLRAVGKAHVKTGVPIFTHNAVYPPDQRALAMKAAMGQMDLFESVGVNPQTLIIGHLCCHDDPSAEVPRAVAKRGAFVGFDRITLEGIISDEKRLTMALAVLDAGYADKLVLAADFYGDERASGHPGGRLRSVNGRPPGWARTATVFGPMLRNSGVAEATVRQILNDNPRRFLAFVPKKTS
jgi:phosphotriesterase-related protein